MLLNGKIALITGVSAGIGKAIAYSFAAEGASLILIARRIDKVKSLAEDLQAKHGTKSIVLEIDVRDFNSVESVISGLPQEWKNIDILVNNAGKSRGLDKIYEGKISDWDEMIDTNIKGLLYFSRCIIPDMVRRNSGHVVNIGSIAGEQIYPNGNVYCGTKAAVHTITQGMVIDLNGTKVKVTNIAPGLVETEFAEVRFHGDKEKGANVYKGYKPLEAEDVAEIALFCVTRKPHVQIQDILVTPADQAMSWMVNKKL